MGTELPLRDVVFTLLFRVGVVSAMAAVMTRSTLFQRSLLHEERSLDERLRFVLFYGPLVSVGVLTRVLLRYQATDVSLEGALVAGLVYGRMAGMMVGVLAALPSFFNHELVSLPFAVLCGAAGGLLREVTANKEHIWSFGPSAVFSIPRWLIRLLRGQPTWQLLPLLLCIGLESLRIFLGSSFPGALYYVHTQPGWPLLLPVLGTIAGVALSLMIWNSSRIRLKLQEQEASLLAARMEALTSQINPHFLFNTLNTIGSLTRFDPEGARELLVKLSSILRRLLRKHENFVPLRDELTFIDDYLDIEMRRFGPEKLRFQKEIEESTLDAMVPSMLLQPMIENSIRHGLAPRLEGGEIRLRTSRSNGRVVINVEDNGMGIAPERIPDIYSSGIGISNVNERLKVLYGEDYVLKIESEHGRGTSIRIEIPELFGA